MGRTESRSCAGDGAADAAADGGDAAESAFVAAEGDVAGGLDRGVCGLGFFGDADECAGVVGVELGVFLARG
jgi:hypothetical protein